LYHAKHLVPELPSFLQDTPDLLRHFENLNQEELPINAFPISIDVVGLYSNIPMEEGIECLREALNTRKDQTTPTTLLITLLTLVLSLNIFEFGTQLFQQLLGTAMGTKVAPTFANIFMGKLDKMILNTSNNCIRFYKRFIDDILIFWTSTEEDFLEFMTKINNLHETIKFTHSYNISDKSTTYLDMTIKLKNGKVVTDFYRKPTDKIQYLLPSSCHPSHTFKSIPYSLAIRLVRICSTKQILQQRLGELKTMLLSRKYNKNVVNAAIEKAWSLDRNQMLKKREKKQNDRVVLALTFNPKLPSVSKIINKHWKTMTKDPNLCKIFKKPPMLAFKQPPNLRSMLCHAKLPANKPTKRKLVGIKPCNEPCSVCPYIDTSKEFHSNQTKEKFQMTESFNCSTKGIIYLTTCTHCNKQYVGQSGRKLKERIKEHLYNILQKKEVTGVHYSLPGHSHWNFKVQIIERVTPNTPTYRLEREDHWIKKLATKIPLGLNKND
jgi:hypothetical protein